MSASMLPWLLALALKGTLACGAALLACALLRRAAPALRHAVLLAGLASLVLLPVLTATLPSFGLHLPWLPGAGALQGAHQDRLTMVVARVSQGNESRPRRVRSLDEQGKPATAGDLLEAAAALVRLAVAHAIGNDALVKRHAEPGTERAHGGEIRLALPSGPDAVVDVAGMKDEAEDGGKGGQHRQKRGRIGAARDAGQHDRSPADPGRGQSASDAAAKRATRAD